METENDYKLAFLDTAVSREPDGRLTTSAYRKPTHTDQYLAYNSHHPQSVKRGIVKCLYELAKRLVTKPSVISKEKKHLSSVLVSNYYPLSFLQTITKTRKPSSSAEPKIEYKSTVILPYVKGLSEQLLRCLQQEGIHAVFRSETTLRSHLVQAKDAVEPTKQDGVVYRIPCECGKVYIGETGSPMQDRMKEHERDIRLARTQTSAVSEHANNTAHNPLWNEDFTLKTSTGIVEYKFRKHGCPRSRNTTTGEPYDSGPPKEQHTETARIEMHQSQLLKTNQSQRSILVKR